VGRRIAAVHGAPDPIVLEGLTPAGLRRALGGRRVEGVERHGKHLWLALDRRPWPCFHFGMTGGFHARLPLQEAPGRGLPRRSRGEPGVRGHGGRPESPMFSTEGGVHLVSYGDQHPAEVWPPRFTKLRLGLDDGVEVAFSDGRRLGRVRLRHDPRAEPPVSDLGFDAWHDLPSPRRFVALLRERGAPLKALLLDQTFAAGVGNWIADEVLYQARLSPLRRPASLSAEEARRLRQALRHVIGTAVRLGSDSDRYPRTWLFHVRWGRKADASTAHGHRIRHDTIGGRTTAWVPALQR
jgi:formamidopyrimidine-DNA glycosylase